jgi:hypothetical protein
MGYANLDEYASHNPDHEIISSQILPSTSLNRLGSWYFGSTLTLCIEINSDELSAMGGADHLDFLGGLQF